jgi:hypothetical protein
MAPPKAALGAASPQGARALGRPGGASTAPPEAALRAASPPKGRAPWGEAALTFGGARARRGGTRGPIPADDDCVSP